MTPAMLAVLATLACVAAIGAEIAPAASRGDSDAPVAIAAIADDDRPPPADPGAGNDDATDEPLVDPPPRTAALPLRASFRLRDGERQTGELTAWNDAGIEGDFGALAWTDLHHEDILRLRRRLMNRADAAEWLALGRTLLLATLDQPVAARPAEQALRRAATMDPALVERVEAVRTEVEAERALRERLAHEAEAARLRTRTPEAGAWGPSPWPAMSPAEQAEATEEMKRDTERILSRAGLVLEPVETDFFLLYSDLPAREVRKWAKELDRMYARLAREFALAPNENVFWGKAVVLVFARKDRFHLVLAQAFNHQPAEWVDGMCLPMGPKVFVAFHRQPQDEAFAAVLVHETTHGFMHRYLTPMRLPTWANEGLSDWMAATLFKGSTVDSVRRPKGLAFVRAGGNVPQILDMSYDDGSWPGPEEVGYSVGYLLVELMIRENPNGFADWVRAVKQGEPWERALEIRFGSTREHLADVFAQWYRVND